MSGGSAVTGRKTPGWCGPEAKPTTRPGVFRPTSGLGLDGHGVADPQARPQGARQKGEAALFRKEG